MAISKSWWPIVALFGIVCLFHAVQGLVVGIDFGSDSFKVVLVRPGSIDIVLNEGSGRKTVSSVGYSHHGRLFGDQVQQLVCGPFFFSPSQHRTLSSIFQPSFIPSLSDIILF
jgi:hypothetical protein